MKKIKRFSIVIAMVSLIITTVISLGSCDFLSLFSGNEQQEPKDTVTVTFNADDGTKTFTQTVNHGAKLTQPEAPTRIGYIFDGWYVGGERWSFADGCATADMTLVAKWIPMCRVELFITSDVDSDNWREYATLYDTLYALPGDTLTLPILENPDENSEFVGWVDLQINEIHLPGTDVKVQNNLTYVGKWKQDFGYEGNEYPVKWKNTELVYELNEHTQQSELSSGTRRYYAGDSQGSLDRIDTKINERNAAAEREANVTVLYKYVGTQQENEFSWSKSISRISDEAFTYGPGSTDIYCNFAYDMTFISIKGGFANLKGTYGEDNFFEFNKADYVADGESSFDRESGDGYFYDYMESLSLSDDKMYILASNYTTDVPRAFAVIPVNIGMLSAIPESDLPEGSLLEAGKSGIQHLYDIIWNNKWTYDTLAAYSNAVFQNNNANKLGGELGVANLGDKLGFAIGCTEELPAAALLYSTGVKIIDKTACMYPSDNAQLVEIAVALKGFFDGNKNLGVTVVNGTEAFAFDGSEGELVAIRKEFAKGNILFGGVTMVGNLENEFYQSLREEGGYGFGIAPIPLYKPYEEGTNEYNTYVHNLARVVAISGRSTKIAQCSAYLDYLSRNSADVLDEYYESVLSYSEDGETSCANAKMMTYIRNHARDSFDATYDIIIGNFEKKLRPEVTHKNSENYYNAFLAGRFCVGASIETFYLMNYSDNLYELLLIKAEWNKIQ